MPLQPTPADAPRIRGALKLYRVTSIITGTFLLLLVLMMVFRYGFLVDIEMGGPFGFLALQPREQIKAIDLSTAILIAHGWFYVLYLFSDFRLWSIMRWDFKRFLLIALGGVIPFLSFIMERRVHRATMVQVERLEAGAARPSSAASTPATNPATNAEAAN